MRIKVTMSLLLLAAACATQALANYFYNPYANLSPNIASAASPTPRDTRKNRLPKVRAAPPYAIIVAADTAKHTDKPARNDQSSSQDGEEAKDRREL